MPCGLHESSAMMFTLSGDLWARRYIYHLPWIRALLAFAIPRVTEISNDFGLLEGLSSMYLSPVPPRATTVETNGVEGDGWL